jgi:DNA-binding beta-propeller fold protein YncE
LTLIDEFLIGGTGTGNINQLLGPDDIDKEMAVSADRRFLFAVNSGSDTIAMLRIHSDGSLEPVPGSPFPSGGRHPVSVALQGGNLYVANKNQDPDRPNNELPNYVGFRVVGERLELIPNSTITDGFTSSPASVLSSPVDERQLFAVTFGIDVFGRNPAPDSHLHSFRIGADGRLTEAPNSPQFLFGTGINPPIFLGLLAHPSQRILYVGFVAAGFVGVYTYDSNGVLKLFTAVPNTGKLVCWLAMNPTETFFYTSDNGNDSVSVYDIRADPKVPAEVQRVALREFDATPSSPFELSVEPGGRFLYVVGQRHTTDPKLTGGNGIHVLQIGADGLLSEAPFSPVPLPIPVEAHPHGMIVF